MGNSAVKLDIESASKWIGHEVEVFWPKERKWYVAKVVKFDRDDQQLELVYDEDGSVERLPIGPDSTDEVLSPINFV